MIRSRVWTAQPPPGTPIDWDNPLANTLRFAYHPAVSFDLVSGVAGTLANATPLSLITGDAGLTRNFAENNQQQFLMTSAMKVPQGITMAALCRPIAASATNQLLFGGQYGTGGAPYVTLDIEFNVNNGVNTARANCNVNGSLIDGIDTVVPTLSRSLLHVATFSGSVLQYWIDGQLMTSQGVGPGVIQYDSSSYIGVGNTTASCEVFCGYSFASVLTQAEIATLAANPWQLFWMRRRTYSLANTSTGVVLSGAIVEQPDAVAGTTTLTVSASGAMTEGADASAGTLTATVTASGAITDQPDAMTGLVSGGYTLSGAIVEGSDISAGAVAASVSTSGAMVEAPDAVSGRIGASVSASGAMVEGVDAITGLISTATVVTLTGAVVDAPDAVSGAVSASVSVSGSVVESADTARGSAAFAVSAAAAIFEGADIASGTLGGSISASGSIVEGGDQASGLIFLGVAQEAACTLGPVTQNQSTVQVTVNLSTLGPVAQNQSTLQVIS